MFAYWPTNYVKNLQVMEEFQEKYGRAGTQAVMSDARKVGINW